MARISNMTIDGRVLSRLVIDGKEVSFAREPVTPDCLCFTAEEPNSTVKMVAQGSAPVVNIQTSRDGISWTPYVIGTDILLQNVDDIVYWKAVGSNSVMAKSSSNYNKFVMTGKIAASGNINSLLEENEETARTMSLNGKRFCYTYLFFGCSVLTQAPELPATRLDERCYYNMFKGCTSLTQAPELPATTLASTCYSSMFSDCTSLTQAPKLPATTLPSACYNNMFQNCTSLTQAPALPATTLNEYCYDSMFKGCTSLTQAPKLPATTLTNFCYQWMFYNCSSLTQAPELPATTLTKYSYNNMFYGCSALTQAPELPATTLARGCYDSMFYGCRSLSSLKVAFTAWESQTANWLTSVANTGTFKCPQALIDNTTERTTSTVPLNWTMEAI